ncbi:uncharacterized protein F5891DRAFT_1055222 [Suillus fuscotomentosus]|uniref:Uncharacterized protein n=1 Tax=Suillus fuscotomentosus TaxID=1912939 RepID=A0AAD4DY76_9AGAM|nr:uncharacterized protein F5891DRAFT_1055222 [Suillus fuscotomentosus]KAG1896122.1 hypothetical protein F5891DRAFT_1055222 [Suillus fuscotomentosus]
MAEPAVRSLMEMEEILPPPRELWTVASTSCINHQSQGLAEMMHNLMEISLAPRVVASPLCVNSRPKSNIIICLWTHAFHKLLEAFEDANLVKGDTISHCTRTSSRPSLDTLL